MLATITNQILNRKSSQALKDPKSQAPEVPPLGNAGIVNRQDLHCPFWGQAQVSKIANACAVPFGDRRKCRKSNIRLLDPQHKPAQVIIAPTAVLVFLVVWTLVVRLGRLSPYILPGPERVWARLVSLGWPTLLYHAGVTMGEVLAGLALGMAVAFSLGYLLARSVLLERLLAPYIVASQSVPTVAIAPILVIWLGTGSSSKSIVAALIVFFPILINTIAGLRAADPGLRELMRSLNATRWQMLTALEIPSALPVMLSGLKVGATLSVIGAVVGEFVGADRGLGFLINQGHGLYDTGLMFVAVLTLAAMSIGLYTLVTLIEHWLLAWRQE